MLNIENDPVGGQNLAMFRYVRQQARYPAHGRDGLRAVPPLRAIRLIRVDG